MIKQPSSDMWKPWGSDDNTEPVSPVEERIESSKHSSVTETVLTETRKSRWIRRDKGWVHDRPLISYLIDNEQPNFVFETTDRISSGVEGEFNPEKPYRAFCCVTDRRFLIVIGQKPKNSEITVDFDSVFKFALKPGSSDPDQPHEVDRNQVEFSPIIHVQTTDEQIDFPITNSVKLPDIDLLGQYVVDKTGISDWAYSGHWKAVRTQQKKKQQAWEKGQERKRKQRAERRKAEAERRKREAKQRKRALEKLADKSTSETVTPDTLDPVYDHLMDDEFVGYILSGGERVDVLLDSDGEYAGHQIVPQKWTAVSSHRIILAYHSTEETLEYGLIERVGIHQQSREEGQDRTYLQIDTPDLRLLLDASNFTSIHLQELVADIRDKVQRQ